MWGSRIRAPNKVDCSSYNGRKPYLRDADFSHLHHALPDPASIRRVPRGATSNYRDTSSRSSDGRGLGGVSALTAN